jgi:MFS family permease
MVLALCLAESTVTFETSMIYAAIPTLIRTFGDPFLAGQLVAVHPLIAAATAPVVGRFGDMRGRKSMIVILLAAALAGSLLSALSHNFVLIMIGRALQGLSVTVLPLSIGLLRETMSRDRLRMSIGVLTTAQGVGSALGLVLGGAIVDHFNWQFLFLASALLVLISLIACWRYLPATRPAEKGAPIDWIEGLLPIPGIVAVMLAIGMIKQYGVFSPQVMATSVAGLAIMWVWGRRTLAARDPFINLRLFAVRDFAIANAATLLLAMGTMQIVYIASTYVQSPRWTGVGLGLTAMAAGLAKLPSHGVTVTAGPLASWLALRIGHRRTFVMSCLIAALGWVYALTLPDSLVKIMLLLCVTSYGTTMVVTATANVIVDVVPERRTSEAIGTMAVIRSIGLALGAQFIAISLSSFTVLSPDGSSHFPSADSFRITMGWIAATSFAAMFVAMFLKGGRRDVTAEASVLAG